MSLVITAATSGPIRSLEHRALSLMLRSYCRREHSCEHRQERLCIGCLELHAFVDQKLPACSRGDAKHACVNCRSTCLPGTSQRKLQQITRSEWPKLMLTHPVTATRYWLLRRRPSA